MGEESSLTNDASIIVPVIDDSDIAWACRALGLPTTAFTGTDGNDPRLRIIRSMDTLDIEACPGSGKTTLLVAKLAMVARTWTDPRRGLCVLSHTNVARREIETRLGNTAAGQRLLGYPHFVGTIHGFVNEFLALPWLRSLGYPIEMIDDYVCLRRRWRKLPHHVRRGLKNNRYTEQILRFRDKAFGLGQVRWGKGTLRTTTETYRAMRSACQASAQEGYFCHDEMFVWAHDALDTIPRIIESLRARFPLLFIDEVQDNSKSQSTLLYRVFTDGDNPVIRQRFGDANQSIYQYGSQPSENLTDSFPIPEIRVDMPNSFRFDQSIADLAEPLAVEPQGLQGMRQQGLDGKHCIFLFGDDTIGRVLECYAEYLAQIFSKSELREGLFTAIGAVHRSDDDDNVPKSVHHYWPAYDHEIGSTDPRPNSFVQYVASGNRLAHSSGEAYSMVEKVADGLLRLIKISRPELKTSGTRRRHRRVLELLAEDDSARGSYLDLVRELCVDGIPLTRACWEGNWKGKVTQIVAAVGGTEINNSVVQRFLAWNTGEHDGEYEANERRSNNIFCHLVGDCEVNLRVGSIHSAKGETHTSTLVLDTFYRAHHLKFLKAWLSGQKSGGGDVTSAVQSRLRLHYVAMSRPSQLLCLAIRENALFESDLGKLRGHGWRVGRVTHKDINWLK